MMFQLGSLFGIIIGYFLCYGHAKLTLAIYARSPEGRREEADRLHAEWVAHQPPPQPQPPVTDTAILPPSLHGDGRPLSEVWNLPTHDRPAVCDPLIRTRFAPHGYGAAQILGYSDLGGREHPSLYPGGKETYLDTH